jgi:predicted GH43/DUF377 family glycosyl hydrolase
MRSKVPGLGPKGRILGISTLPQSPMFPYHSAMGAAENDVGDSNPPTLGLSTRVVRAGVVLESNAEPSEAEGVLNPACTRNRAGALLLYPRCVAQGNVSRIGILQAHGSPDAPTFTRIGYALEPQEPYEIRSQPGGYGCEDPRVTFIKDLDAYVMAYVAHGPQGPRVAVAVSHDAYEWERLGLVTFAPGLPNGLDKDAAFFPDLVLSPSGVLSFAMYHRPTLPISTAGLLGMPLSERESTRIAYVHAAPVLLDRMNLLEIAESACVLEPIAHWGHLKTGAGTPPVRIDEGWLSVYHAVDAIARADGSFGVKYQAGLVVHDFMSPHLVRYRSPEPILSPETSEELHGVMNNVVFPTAIDVRTDIAARTYDIYYGMADSRIGRVQLSIAASMPAEGADLAA